eukprot:1558199-Pyramimonas_sp.AAC.1
MGQMPDSCGPSAKGRGVAIIRPWEPPVSGRTPRWHGHNPRQPKRLPKVAPRPKPIEDGPKTQDCLEMDRRPKTANQPTNQLTASRPSGGPQMRVRAPTAPTARERPTLGGAT